MSISSNRFGSEQLKSIQVIPAVPSLKVNFSPHGFGARRKYFPVN
jgi:hypothetical protein